MTVDGLEKERDFYFGKLREIELMCQEPESEEPSPIVRKILDVLYATEVKMQKKIETISLLEHFFIFFF